MEILLLRLFLISMATNLIHSFRFYAGGSSSGLRSKMLLKNSWNSRYLSGDGQKNSPDQPKSWQPARNNNKNNFVTNRGEPSFDRPKPTHDAWQQNSASNYNSNERYYEDEIAPPPAYGYYEGDHVYGISPVKLALQSNRRKISELLVQSGMELSKKKEDKSASDILRLAEELGLETREFSKHDLNMLTDNRPHQGFVLRATPLNFTKITELPPSSTFKCVLALDEVWDPQNFGALLRTCHFLGVDGVVVCSKNSAPLSPAVSKASAGAMELMSVQSVDNMMKFLDKSVLNGWQVVGTSVDRTAVDCTEMPLEKPTILVLGNEGHGVRTNILNRCTSLVKIQGSAPPDSSVSDGEESQSGGKPAVDSLNVSVCGGILLHYILSARKGKR